ncbi:MAG TPA: HEAT repeat domain-containing protein, partial [Pyrinomonadaceae bacterium]
LVAESALVAEAEAPAVDESAFAGTTAAEEVAQEAPAVVEVVQEVPAEVVGAAASEELAEASAGPAVAGHLIAPAVETAESKQVEVAEPSFEPAAPAFDASQAETAEVAPVEAEAAEPFVAEAEAPAAATWIVPVVAAEPDFAPDSETVQAETHRLLEGGEYDRAVVGSRDAMARQMVAYELLSALAGRNELRRGRAGAAFVEHGYFEETARDLREADAPAERSAAARALALLGDRKATPLLVAALEDPVMDVRRAAVEALGALRDPSAVEPLEALLERERNERNRILPRVIRNAVETCREGSAATPAPEPRAEAPTAETQAVIPAIETGGPAAGFEAEAAPVEEAARVVEALPAEEPAPFEVAPVQEAVVAPEPPAEAAAPDVAEETSVSITPFVEESDESETLIASGPAAEAFETAAETGVAPYVEPERPFAGQVEEVAVEAREEVAIEPFVGQDEEVSTEGTFDFGAATGQETEQATLFDAGSDEATREIEPVAADSSKELTPAAGEWFDFDIGEMGGGSQPAASEPAAAGHVFETSSGEAFGAPAAAAEVEEAAVEPAPFVEAHAPATRDMEVSEAAAAVEPAPFVREPAAEAREKGIAPFDETSSVPAAIQQRLASRDPNERASAIVQLSHVDTDEAFHQICAAFDDDSRDVRAAAARALYELRADRAESFTRALREATPERRREIGAAIATSGLAGESISQLTGESRERTYEAFSLLFLMAKAGEVQPLLRAIEGHPNSEVRLAVVKLLALSGQKEVLPAFRRLAVRGSLPTEVRSAVMEAIYQISSSQPTHA